MRYSHAGVCQVDDESALGTTALRVAVTVSGLAVRHGLAFDLLGEREVFGCNTRLKTSQNGLDINGSAVMPDTGIPLRNTISITLMHIIMLCHHLYNLL